MSGLRLPDSSRTPSALSSYRRALRASVAAATKAYGFTLVIWTTGALVVAEHGVPRAAEALAFLAGALFGMALIVVVSFGGLRSTWADIELTRRAYGAIHALSVVSAVLLGWLLAAVLDGIAAFLLASSAAVVIYNLVLAAEVWLSIADGDDLGIGTTLAVPRLEDEPPVDADSAARARR